MGLQMKGDGGQRLRPLFSGPASAFWLSHLQPPLTPLSCSSPTILPTDLSFQQTHPYSCSRGGSVLTVPTPFPPSLPGSL